MRRDESPACATTIPLHAKVDVAGFGSGHVTGFGLRGRIEVTMDRGSPFTCMVMYAPRDLVVVLP